MSMQTIRRHHTAGAVDGEHVQVAPSPPGVRAPTVNAAILGALIIAALYAGKVVFLPMAMAILLAFILAPIVRALRTIRIPRIVAVLLVVAATFAALIAAGTVLTMQLQELAGQLPNYESTLRAKVRDLRGSAVSSPAMERAAETLKDLQNELENPQTQTQSKNDADRFAPGTATSRGDDVSLRKPKLVPVEVHYPDPKPLESLLAILAAMVEPIAMLTIVIVLVMFMLMQKEDLRDRLIRLAGATDMQRTTTAMTDAASRLSRFLLNLTLLNFLYGAIMAAALWWLAIPAPILWGILAAFMRYVPILGSFIAAAFPIILAAAIDPGWTTLLITLSFYVVGETLMGQLIEPLMQGKTSGLSPLAILIAAAFWTLLWGPVGLILAVPITLCLVVLSQYVDTLKFLHVLLGDQPALTPAERFYQRTLAGDAAEISEQAEAFVRKQPLSRYYRDVAIEALRLAQADADRGALEPDHMERIDETVETMVDNLWDFDDVAIASDDDREESDDVDTTDDASNQSDETDNAAADVPVIEAERLAPPWKVSHAVICVPAKTSIDRAAAHLLAHIVTRHGVQAEVVERSGVLTSGTSEIDAQDVRVICICALSKQLSQTRFLARRIRRHMPQARIVVVLWSADEGARQEFAASETSSVDRTVQDISEAVGEVISRAEMSDASSDQLREAETSPSSGSDAKFSTCTP